MKPWEQWELYGDLLSKRAYELKEGHPGSSHVAAIATALIGAAADATEVAKKLIIAERDEAKAKRDIS